MQTELCRSNADGRVSRAYSGQGRSVASVHCSPPPPAERTAKSGERARPRTHAPRTRTRSGGSPPPRSRPAAGALSAVLTQTPPRPDQAPRSAGLSLPMVLFPHIHGDSAMSPRGAGTLHSRSPLSPRRVTTHGRSRRGQVHRARARALGRQPCASRGASSTSRPVPAADVLASPRESLPGPARPP